MSAISAISCWPSSLAALSLEASGARPTISRVCASSATSWRSSLATCSWRSFALRLQALAARARLGGGRGQLAQPGLGALERGLGRIVRGERLLLEIRRQRARCWRARPSRLRAAPTSPWPRRSASPRAPCRGRAARRAPPAPCCRSAVRCASRSRLSCSILKRCSTAPLAASCIAQRLQLRGRVGFGP